jgi:uncharacterized membrane protein HdeD (DUF308 family)
MFALDSFAPGLPIWEQLRDFMIHLIPSYVLIMALWLAWKKEKWGGVVFIAIGAITSFPVFLMNYHRTNSIWVSLFIVLIINIPFIMVGALFIISDYLKRKSLPS